MTERPERVCAVSIDLDPIDCYYRIHGLGPAPAHLDGRLVAAAVPRFVAALGARGARGTFFAVTRQLDAAPEVAAVLEQAARAGHELGNHTHTHPYDLARQSPKAVAGEIERAHALLRALVGRPAVGFRAPGYDLPPAAVPVLERLGYRYDSSLFPAPGYYAAKLAVMAAMRVAGRPSGAVATEPRALFAPTGPYLLDAARPWRRGRGPLVELPIAVTPTLRLPVIGTSLLLAPGPVRRRLLAAIAQRDVVNFELHAMDLVGASEDGVPAALVARQPDLRVALGTRRRALDEVLDWFAGRGFRFEPLAEVAARVADQQRREMASRPS